MTGVVDTWSCPTSVFAGGLGQLPLALAGRRMVLVADAVLSAQVDAVLQHGDAAEVVLVDAGHDAWDQVIEAVARHASAVPVALGGGSVMDVVRVAALVRAEPSTTLLDPTDGPRFWPTDVVNPTICLPSTLGTAAEVSPIAIRSDASGAAMLISPGLRAAAAVVDPVITATLTTRQQASGLLEPLARVLVPAVAGSPLLLQDALAQALVRTLLELGDRAGVPSGPDHAWRRTAALTSIQTHTGLLAIGRPPAGHLLWPLATELSRATGEAKASVQGALLVAWLRALADGTVGPAWGSATRAQDVLHLDPATAADRLHRWLTHLELPTRLPEPAADALDQAIDRVVRVWQASGLFLAGVPREEIAHVTSAAVHR